MRFSEDYFYEKYKILPKNVKRAMYSLNIHDIVKSITDKHKLHIDTAGILDDEIMFAIIGITKVSDFIRNLKAQLKLPDEKVNAIAKDVNEKIFLPIRESLKKAGDSSPAESGIRNQELGKPKEIHHPPLSDSTNLVTPPPSESEEIKKQIEEQQAPKKVSAPPPNLPTQPTESSAEPKESHLEVEPPSEKKPSHVDPYREPIE
jgi:hypothetical protein